MIGNGAKALERTDIGTIEVGKRADLVILDGNLKENSTVIKKVETVFKNGVGYDSKKLLLETTNKFGID